jgi:hypothetical protein
MKRILLIAMLTLVGSMTVAAQTQKGQTAVSGTTSGDASARQGQRSVEIASGTQLAAQLQDTLDVRRAHVGDRVVLKTTGAIKQNGHTVVNEVQQRAKGDAASRIGLVFDRLENGSLSMPITATINSVTQVATHMSAADDDTMMDTGASSTTSGRAGSSGGGGLVGGVGNTAGGVVGGVTNTAGNVVNTTTEATGQVVSGATSAVGHTAGGVGRSVSGLRISQSGSASAEGGSTLSLTGGNLRLEKNTTFNLTINEAANVGSSPDDRE